MRLVPDQFPAAPLFAGAWRRFQNRVGLRERVPAQGARLHRGRASCRLRRASRLDGAREQVLEAHHVVREVGPHELVVLVVVFR